jgi:hypothetical protein
MEFTQEGANSDVAIVDAFLGLLIELRGFWFWNDWSSLSGLGSMFVLRISDGLDCLPGGWPDECQIHDLASQISTSQRGEIIRRSSKAGTSGTER